MYRHMNNARTRSSIDPSTHPPTTHTHTHACMHTRKNLWRLHHSHARTTTCMHTTCTHARARFHPCTHACIHRPSAHPPTHSVHVHTHTRAHAHTRAHTRKILWWLCPPPPLPQTTRPLGDHQGLVSIPQWGLGKDLEGYPLRFLNVL